MINFFLEKMRAHPAHEAFVSAHCRATYGDLLKKTNAFSRWPTEAGIPPGSVVSFEGDYSPDAIALFLALAQQNHIIVPLSADSCHNFAEFRDIAMSAYDISLADGAPTLHCADRPSNHPLYNTLRAQQQPGLVLFSSGSTGKSKAIVQNLDKLLAKFKKSRPARRMLIFLQLDHIGGVNSLLYALANQGTVILAQGRTPELVCQAIEAHQAELLPTSPTFLNLILLAKAHTQYDLSSLKLITYGTEPMQSSTLARLTDALPDVKLQQTYGLSEVGILRSKSKEDGSLWMKIGGDEFDIKVHNGTLHVKADSAMLGYLNAPSPFDEAGYLDTGDLVAQDGDWIRILGRASEIINVGGFKVFPAEVESVLLNMDNVADVVVYGEAHPITGHIVTARFKLQQPEPTRAVKARMLSYCKDKLASYKVPSKVLISEDTTYNTRFKRMRRATQTSTA